MTASADLTPPTKSKPQPPKAVPTAASGNGKPAATEASKEKKPRAPRADYGFSPESTIIIVKDKDNKYRGQRLDWFNKIKLFEGKKVADFMTMYEGAKTPKGTADPPRGWVRFFVQDGTVSLTKPPVAATAQPTK